MQVILLLVKWKVKNKNSMSFHTIFYVIIYIGDKMKKVMFCIVWILIIGGIALTSYEFKSKPTYTLDVPNKIEKISINGIYITDEDKFKEIASIFKKKMITKIESIQDSPSCDELLTVSLNNTTVFACKKKYKYFLEQPYNGRYKIDKNTFLVMSEAIR